MRAAIVKDGVVLSVIIVENIEDWPPGEGEEVVEETEATGPASPNGTWDGTVFGPDPNLPPLA